MLNLNKLKNRIFNEDMPVVEESFIFYYPVIRSDIDDRYVKVDYNRIILDSGSIFNRNKKAMLSQVGGDYVIKTFKHKDIEDDYDEVKVITREEYKEIKKKIEILSLL